MLSYTDLKSGMVIVFNGQPYQVAKTEFVRMQQRKPVVKTKIKNLITGAIVEYSFQPSDKIEEAEIERIDCRFLYAHRGEFWFCEADNPKNRFILKTEIIGEAENFLKPDLKITALKFSAEGESASGGQAKIISIELPIKVDYKVIEAPPAIRGDTAQGGNKSVVIETGARVNVPFFINEGDIIKVNTESGEYTERAEKS